LSDASRTEPAEWTAAFVASREFIEDVADLNGALTARAAHLAAQMGVTLHELVHRSIVPVRAAGGGVVRVCDASEAEDYRVLLRFRATSEPKTDAEEHTG
jgi:hypothetical protein